MQIVDLQSSQRQKLGHNMKYLIASVMAGSLVLMAALPAAGQSARSMDSNASALNSASDRGTYVQMVRDEVQEWRQKMRDFSDSAQTKATEANKAAVDDLTRAWTRTEAASRRLENAGTADWQGAKASYKTASKKLVLAWHKVDPTEK
jgi:anaerobic glycerol-3-phosphate dehydrogenase